jgi:hypothetical protein
MVGWMFIRKVTQEALKEYLIIIVMLMEKDGVVANVFSNLIDSFFNRVAITA